MNSASMCAISEDYRLHFRAGGSPQLYYHDCSGRIPGHTTRAPPVGFVLETNGFQLYAIANFPSTISETHFGPLADRFMIKMNFMIERFMIKMAAAFIAFMNVDH